MKKYICFLFASSGVLHATNTVFFCVTVTVTVIASISNPREEYLSEQFISEINNNDLSWIAWLSLQASK